MKAKARKRAEESTETWQNLVSLATTAKEDAYAPYTGLRFGAAALADDSRVFSGCSIENASFALSVCAEQVAIFNAISSGVRTIHALAVTGDVERPPCGACLQVLAEFATGQAIIMLGAGDRPTFIRLSEALPLQFRLLGT